MWSRNSGADGLPALDPYTGEELAGREAHPPVLPSHSAALRARRHRRIAAWLAALSLLAAVAAIYSTLTIASLRRVEREWRTAMALDRHRMQTEGRIMAIVGSFGERYDLAVPDLRLIEREETARLLVVEEALRSQAVPDATTGRLRDAMVVALRSRRSQLRAASAPVPDPRLRRIDTELARQLEKWRLGPRLLRPLPRLTQADGVLAKLGRFADAPTTTVLVGLAGDELVTIDIDASQVRRRRIEPGAGRVIVRGDMTVVETGGTITAYPLDPVGPALWRVPGFSAFAGLEPEVTWIHAEGGVRPVGLDGQDLAPPARLPPGRVVRAVTGAGIVVDGGPGGAIEIMDPSGQRPLVTVARQGRFVAASQRFVAWQPTSSQAALRRETSFHPSPEVSLHVTSVSLESDDVFPLPRADAGPGTFSVDETVLAVPVGPAAGSLAAVLLLDRASGVLEGARGPAASFDGASLTWSADGTWLFWLARDGRIVVDRAGAPVPRILRVRIKALRAIVASTAAQ